MSQSIRIAISGGGLAGACLTQALVLQSANSSQQNLDVHLFESAPAFKEAGAAVGLTKAQIDAAVVQAKAAEPAAGKTTTKATTRKR